MGRGRKALRKFWALCVKYPQQHYLETLGGIDAIYYTWRESRHAVSWGGTWHLPQQSFSSPCARGLSCVQAGGPNRAGCGRLFPAFPSSFTHCLGRARILRTRPLDAEVAACLLLGRYSLLFFLFLAPLVQRANPGERRGGRRACVSSYLDSNTVITIAVLAFLFLAPLTGREEEAGRRIVSLHIERSKFPWDIVASAKCRR